MSEVREDVLTDVLLALPGFTNEKHPCTSPTIRYDKASNPTPGKAEVCNKRDPDSINPSAQEDSVDLYPSQGKL